MKMHSKSISLLIGTLIIGVVVGAMGWSTIHNQRLRQRQDMRRQGGLYASIDRYIDPTDDEQEKALREIGSAYQDTLGRFMNHYLRHRVNLMESFESDILPLLTEDQAEKLMPWLERSTTIPESVSRSWNRNDRDKESESDSTSAQQ